MRDATQARQGDAARAQAGEHRRVVWRHCDSERVRRVISRRILRHAGHERPAHREQTSTRRPAHDRHVSGAAIRGRDVRHLNHWRLRVLHHDDAIRSHAVAPSIRRGVSERVGCRERQRLAGSNTNAAMNTPAGSRRSRDAPDSEFLLTFLPRRFLQRSYGGRIAVGRGSVNLAA